jgi:two-component system LytT family response regulator
MKAIIVDDEEGSVTTLEMLIKKYCPEVNIVATFLDPMKAIAEIDNYIPDILFLDIEMPYANAFDLLDKLAPVNFEVIFVTAFNNYALKAIKYAAVDYLLKPVSIEELKFAIGKAEKQLELRHHYYENIRVSGLLQNLKQSDKGSHKITLPTKNGFEVEEAKNIVYLEASAGYTLLVMNTGNQILVSKGLKEFEEMLADNIFVRVHHSYIVNIQYVKEFVKGRGGTICMKNGDKIEVAVRKKQDFLDKLGLLNSL